MREGKADSNGALSSQNLTANEPRNASYLSTTIKGQNLKEQQPDEIPEEAYPPASAKSEEYTARQEIEDTIE